MWWFEQCECWNCGRRRLDLVSLLFVGTLWGGDCIEGARGERMVVGNG